MTAIAIEHFHTRYRLGAAAGEERRLQRILAGVLDGGLEAAVQRSGIDTRGELCIREINALARLNLDQSDATLEAELALAIADSIARGVSKPNADFIRYSSRAHALIDLAVAALSGDFSRAWAWRQLGLWQAESSIAVTDAARWVVRALKAEPHHALAALIATARQPQLFGRLLQYASPPQFLEFGRLLLARLAPAADVLPAAARENSGEQHSEALESRTQELIDRSAIAAATVAYLDRGTALEPSQLQLLATLAVAECEPALLCMPADRVRELLGLSMEMLCVRVAPMPARDESRSQPNGRKRSADLRSASPQDAASAQAKTSTTPSREVLSEGPLDARASVRASEPAPASAPSARHDARNADASARKPDTAAPRDSTAPDREHPRPVESLVPREQRLPELRRRAATRFGGLLYLIHLLRKPGIVQRIVAEPRLGARAPRWSLHQLALALVPVPSNDPVALAFAGLLPESEAPDHEQPLADIDEQAAIAELRDELLAALRALLQRAAGVDRAQLESPVQLIDFVCRRRAEIVADPGWLEVHFLIEDVRAEIRIVGLDLNPDWVPWLGLVVRFVYG